MKSNQVLGVSMVVLGVFLALFSLGQAQNITQLDFNMLNGARFAFWGALSMVGMSFIPRGVKLALRRRYSTSMSH